VNLERTLGLARDGRLYPAVILHGATAAERQLAAVGLARTLLCAGEAGERPCGHCPHCRRVVWPGGEVESFHPDFHVVERDLKTSTSAEATRTVLRQAQLSPFEARGQVFVIAAAETLSAEASDALLKAIEEPGLGAPRHFLLLCPSRLDLAPTIRSRAFALFLGPAEPLGEAEVEAAAAGLLRAVVAHRAGAGGWALLAGAAALAASGGFEDPRAGRPWGLAAAAAARAAQAAGCPPEARRGLLDLADDLLQAAPLRLRGIPAERILEGLVARRLAG
jgi:DNA polymerase-3 subunit delta'